MPEASTRLIWLRPVITCVVVILLALTLAIGLRPQVTVATDVAQKHNADTAKLLGIDRIEPAKGRDVPTGRGIVVGHVEGGPGDYQPHQNSPLFQGVTFTQHSGPSKVSSHAHGTARIIYGPAGLAPGVTKVHLFNSAQWTTAGYLGVNTSYAPQRETIQSSNIRVFNHSWIGPMSAFTQNALRRVDYVVDRYDVIMCVGVDNGASKSVPALFASAYNVIAVGTWTGESSGGFTLYEGEDRCKPDIVAPRGQTSFTTPAVTAVVARLLEAAEMIDDERGKRAETIKAVLLAGAEKNEHWRAEPGRPLDEHLGAGIARADRSYAILTGSVREPGDEPVTMRPGWHMSSLAGDGQVHYTFDVAQGAKEVSIALVWHRRIDGSAQSANAQEKLVRWAGQPRLADFDLKWSAELEDGSWRELASSISRVDNVEHLYLSQLPAGRYRLRVVRKDALAEHWDYALAWWLESPGQGHGGNRP